MQDKYILKPTNTEYSISENFPQLSEGKKVGIFLSGGLESTLILKIALDVYGKDRVMAFYSDDIFTYKSKNGNQNVWTNVSNSAKNLNITPTYLEVDYDLHMKDPMASAAKLISDGSKKYNVEFTMWGFTKLFYSVSEFKTDINSTHDSIMQKCFSNYEKYKDIIEEFHLPTGKFSQYVKDLDIPSEVYFMLEHDRNNGYKIKSPFRTLNKGEVVDLYRQLGCLDLAYSTRSCVTDSIREIGKHCGKCFNCQQRYDAFAVLNVEDKTQYASSNVVDAWITLQNKLHP